MAGTGKGPLRIAFEDFLENGPMGKLIRGGVSQWIDDYEKDMLEVNRELLDMILEIDDLPPQIRNVVTRVRSGSHQAGAVSVAAVAIGAVVAIVLGMMGPVSRSGEHWLDSLMRSARFDPVQNIQANWRVPGWSDHPYRDMVYSGWPERNIKAWEAILEPQVAESDLMRLYHRHANQRDYVVRELGKRGWSNDNIQRLIEASKIYPGLQDLVHMAVREAFDPAQRQALGLDNDFPPEFGRRGEQLGVDPDFIKDYWAAHWQLPSLTMAFEMYHRLRPGRYSNPVTLEVLDGLIKAHDISPTWRDRLREISHATLTRVDIRRIYDIGGLTKEEVYEKYRDLGYTEGDARLLTDYATLEGGESGKSLTRSAIQSAYGKGLLDFNTALSELMDLGYDEYEASFWLQYEDYQRQEKLAKLETDVIELRLMAGEISLNEAETQLNQLQLQGEQVRLLVEEWRLRKAKQIKVPTKAELEDLYEEDIIDYDTMARYMRGRGYEPEVADWMISLIDIKVQEKRQTELERTRKEEERLSTKEESTEYQIAKSKIDTEIAEWRAYIADLKLTAHFVEDPDQIELIKQEIDQTKLTIANLAIDKANLKTDFLSSSQEGEA